ncbi:MAG: hypothetical protein KKB59_18970 [Spirochaetes bacterium]|nr:hypothetical protein [Spirochaetota bacterium]
MHEGKGSKGEITKGEVMGLIADFKKWWRRDEYIKNMQRIINSQGAMNMALIQQSNLFVSDLQNCVRSFRDQKHSSKLSREMMSTLDNFVSRFEQ